MAIWTPNNNKTDSSMNVTKTEENTVDIDSIIAEIAQLKAQRCNTEEELNQRDAKIQALTAQRNAYYMK